MTNTIYLVSLVVTQWVALNPDRQTIGGTNYFWAVPVAHRDVYVFEVTQCTNKTLYQVGPPATNGMARWVPVPVLPVLPSVGQKE